MKKWIAGLMVMVSLALAGCAGLTGPKTAADGLDDSLIIVSVARAGAAADVGRGTLAPTKAKQVQAAADRARAALVAAQIGIAATDGVTKVLAASDAVQELRALSLSVSGLRPDGPIDAGSFEAALSVIDQAREIRAAGGDVWGKLIALDDAQRTKLDAALVPAGGGQ